MSVIDLSADGVRTAHQFEWQALTELGAPFTPEPFHILKLLLGVEVGGCANSYSSPSRFLAFWFFDVVVGGFFSVRAPERFAEVEFVAQDDWRATLFCPEQCRFHGHGESAV